MICRELTIQDSHVERKIHDVQHRSERKDGCVLPRPEHVHDGLTHEKANGDANGDCNHGIADLNTITLGGDTSRL